MSMSAMGSVLREHRHRFWAIILLSGFVASCNTFSAAPTIYDIRVCEQNSEYQCVDEQLNFTEASGTLMVTADISVRLGTSIRVDWEYLDGELGAPMVIESTSYTITQEGINSIYSILSRPENGWPQGDYGVVLSTSNGEVVSQRRNFSISTP